MVLSQAGAVQPEAELVGVAVGVKVGMVVGRGVLVATTEVGVAVGV